MKVIAWNMRRSTAASLAWRHFKELAPDVALLQEVNSVPKSIVAEYQVFSKKARKKTGGEQKFSTVIMCRGEIDPFLLKSQFGWVQTKLDEFQGNILGARIETESRNLLSVVSVYSPAWPVDDAESDPESVAAIKLNQNPRVWGTELLWDGLRNADLNNESWIVGGDLNSSVTFDTMWPGGLSGNQEIQDRMSALGLTEILASCKGELTPTFQNPSNKKVIHQIDHLFLNESLLPRVKNCDVGDAGNVFGQSLSDHLPIIAELAF